MRPLSTGIRFLILFLLLAAIQLPFTDSLHAEPDDPKLANKRCMMCHGKEGFSRDGRDLSVMAAQFDSSVHGSQDCVGCHQDVTKVPHRKGIERKVGCVQCHLDEWGEAQENGTEHENGKLENVVDHIESYMDSMHARPRIDDQTRTNAACHTCPGSHGITAVDRESGFDNFTSLADNCGTCHSEVRATYQASVHGRQVAQGILTQPSAATATRAMVSVRRAPRKSAYRSPRAVATVTKTA